MYPLFDLPSFLVMTVSEQITVLEMLMEVLVNINVIWLRKHAAPKLYDLKPRYIVKPRPFALDCWQDIPATVKYGTGDCKDFVAYRCAELRVEGTAAKVKVVKDGEVFHFIVVHHENVIEDPSERLGMQAALQAALGLHS
jgi:hypothetical protein